MKYARWFLVSLIFAVSAACSRQQNTSHEPTLPESAAHVRNPNSTSADFAVPLCPAKFNDSLESNGVASAADKGVTYPVIIHTTEPELSDEARKWQHNNKKSKFDTSFAATNVVGLVVNAGGEPQSICICRSVGYGLDAKAAEAIQQYRFRPATKGSAPVAYRISVQVDFRVY
jgi:TonB family protein